MEPKSDIQFRDDAAIAIFAALMGSAESDSVDVLKVRKAAFDLAESLTKERVSRKQSGYSAQVI